MPDSFTSPPTGPIQPTPEIHNPKAQGNEVALGVQRNIPFSLYEGRFDKPYSLNFFDVKDDSLKTKEIGSFVDTYIKQVIEDRELKDDFDTYKSLVEELESLIGSEEHELGLAKMNRIYNLVVGKNKQLQNKIRLNKLKKSLS